MVGGSGLQPYELVAPGNVEETDSTTIPESESVAPLPIRAEPRRSGSIRNPQRSSRQTGRRGGQWIDAVAGIDGG